jgi:hypothetical protein
MRSPIRGFLTGFRVHVRNRGNFTDVWVQIPPPPPPDQHKRQRQPYVLAGAFASLVSVPVSVARCGGSLASPNCLHCRREGAIPKDWLG